MDALELFEAFTPKRNKCVRSGSSSISGGGGGGRQLPRNESTTVKCCSRARLDDACSHASLSLRVAAAKRSDAPLAASTKSIEVQAHLQLADLTLVLSNGNVARELGILIYRRLGRGPGVAEAHVEGHGSQFQKPPPPDARQPLIQ